MWFLSLYMNDNSSMLRYEVKRSIYASVPGNEFIVASSSSIGKP